jgi:hypothetical protein
MGSVHFTRPGPTPLSIVLLVIGPDLRGRTDAELDLDSPRLRLVLVEKTSG